MERYRHITEKLTGLCQKGRRWAANCPAHEDKKQSLQLTIGETGNLLLKCFAGCGTEDVVGALGIGMGDLFLDKKQAARKRQVKSYGYTDEHGKLLYEVVRYEPKDFRPRRPDGSGGWIWDMEGVDRTLYRLPEVVAAKWVFFVEGEKDADRLGRLKMVATTTGSATSWRGTLASWFEGKNVVVFPDADIPGHRFAIQVAADIARWAAGVMIVPLPGLKLRGDVSTWLDEGKRGKRDLWNAVKEAAKDRLDACRKEMAWLEVFADGEK